MSSTLPPPLPDPVQLRKILHTWGWVFRAGIVLAAGPLWGLLATGLGMLRTFGAMNGNVADAARSITSGVTMALVGTAIGLGISPIGAVLIVLARSKLDRAKRQLSALEAADQAGNRTSAPGDPTRPRPGR
jgi:biopolymer transport protein ExbB/TolQ